MSDDSSACAAPVEGPRLSSGARRLWPWVRQEIVLLAREPVAVLFSLAFPLVILAFIGAVYADEVVEEGVLLIDTIFPALVATVDANLAIMAMPVYFAEIRGRGVLKRYRTMPMPSWLPAGAVVLSLLALFLVSAALLTALVAVTYRVQSEIVSAPFLLLLLLFMVWVNGLGFFLGSLPCKVRTTQAIATATFFLMFFGSGVAAPLEGLPAWLEATTQVNPMRHWFDGLIAAYLGEFPSAALWAKMLAVIPVTGVLVLLGLRSLRRETSN